MNRAAKIAAWGAAALTVAGLGALAVPAVASIGAFTAPIFENAAAVAAEPSPAATPEPPATDPAYEAAAKASAEAAGLQYLGDGVSKPMGGPGNCTTDSMISVSSHGDGPMTAKLVGTPVDMGAAPGANGTVTLDGKGQIVAYEVAAGDVLVSIGERLCIDYVTVAQLNRIPVGSVRAGDVLVIRPDPTVPFTP